MKLKKTHELDPNKSYLMLAYPHGVAFPVGFATYRTTLLYFATTYFRNTFHVSFLSRAVGSNALDVDKIFPEHITYCSTASTVYKFVLGCREHFLAQGCISAEKHSLQYILGKPK